MQFGQALERLITAIVHANPRYGPVKLIKVDISDGFYRIWLRPQDVPKLGVSFPSAPGEPPLVAFPLVLPMGWTESPPYFCSVTETIADTANRRLLRQQVGPNHRLEIHTTDIPSSTNTISPQQKHLPVPTHPDPLLIYRQRILALVEVFVPTFHLYTTDTLLSGDIHFPNTFKTNFVPRTIPPAPSAFPTSSSPAASSNTKLRFNALTYASVRSNLVRTTWQHCIGIARAPSLQPIPHRHYSVSKPSTNDIIGISRLKTISPVPPMPLLISLPERFISPIKNCFIISTLIIHRRNHGSYGPPPQPSVPR